MWRCHGWAGLGCWAGWAGLAGLGSLTGVKVVAVCVPAARTSTNGHGLPARPRIHDIFLLGGGTRPGAGGTGAGGGGQLLGCGQGAARGRRRPRCAWCGVPAPDRAVSAFHCGRSRSRVYSSTAHRTITLHNILQWPPLAFFVLQEFVSLLTETIFIERISKIANNAFTYHIP